VIKCIPYRRALSGGRCRGSSATLFQFIFVTDCQPHPTVYRRWPSFSGRRCSRLEQSAWSCHFHTFRSCLLVSAQNSPVCNISYPSPLWLYSARAVTLSCFRHCNRSSFLTYLLKTYIVGNCFVASLFLGQFFSLLYCCTQCDWLFAW